MITSFLTLQHIDDSGVVASLIIGGHIQILGSIAANGGNGGETNNKDKLNSGGGGGGGRILIVGQTISKDAEDMAEVKGSSRRVHLDDEKNDFSLTHFLHFIHCALIQFFCMCNDIQNQQHIPVSHHSNVTGGSCSGPNTLECDGGEGSLLLESSYPGIIFKRVTADGVLGVCVCATIISQPAIYLSGPFHFPVNNFSC